MTDQYQTVLWDKEEGVGTLTLNRPERKNSMTSRMLVEASEIVARARKDTDLRVLVLTGSGTSFCPGSDLDGMAAGQNSDTPISAADFNIVTDLHEMSAVTVCAINGACAGAGLGWALACDLRIATRSAKFNVAFLNVGVAGDMGLPWTLPRLVGAAKARELCFLPGKITADEALRIGIVNRVVDDEQFHAEVTAVVQQLRSWSPLALGTLKSNFVDAEKLSLASFVQLESERHLQIWESADVKEALAAITKNRAPQMNAK